MRCLMKRTQKVFKIIGFALIVSTLYLAFIAVRIWSYGNIDEREQADAIIVLGAAVWYNNPSPVFLERIRHGIWLYENGYANYLIFTGGHGDGAEYSESYVAMNYAIAAGIPVDSILIEEYSRTTADNFLYAKNLIEDYDISTAIVVSDPLHMYRAMRMARDNGIVALSSPTPTTKYQTLETQLPFLRREVFYYTGYRLINVFN